MKTTFAPVKRAMRFAAVVVAAGKPKKRCKDRVLAPVILVGCVPEPIASFEVSNNPANIILIQGLFEMMTPAALHQPFKHRIFIGFIHDVKGSLAAE